MQTSPRRAVSYPSADRSDRPDIPLHFKNLVDALELDVMYVQGTNAARLAAGHMAGIIWRETDTGTFFWDTGAAWVQIGALAADVHKYGTNASRLASATLPINTIWFESDTGKAYRTDGAGNAAGNWSLVAAAAGAELDVQQITANPSAIAATTEATSVAIMTGNSVTYDGTKVRIEVNIWLTGSNAGTFGATLVVYRDAVVVGQSQIGIQNQIQSYPFACFDTPGAGSHVYKVAGFVSANTMTPQAGAGGAGNRLPSVMRITKA
jgi:hypothetical protein